MCSKAKAREELNAIMNAAIDARINQTLRDHGILPPPPKMIFVDKTEDMRRKRAFGTYTWHELKTKK